MPVRLRLQRHGRKGRPFYAIVASDSRMRRDGRYLEKIGTYDPVSHPARVFVDHDKALKWLNDGAQPTNTVRSLLRHTGVTVKFSLLFKQGKSEEEAMQIFNRWRAEKDAKKKKKVISVDVHGTPLEPVPGSTERVRIIEMEPVKVEQEPVPEEETPEVADAAAEAPAAEGEEAPAAEAPAEEAPAEEEKKEE